MVFAWLIISQDLNSTGKVLLLKQVPMEKKGTSRYTFHLPLLIYIIGNVRVKGWGKTQRGFWNTIRGNFKTHGASLVAQTVKRLPASRRPGFNSWVGKIPWRRKWQSTPALLPGKSHGQRSLISYSPWGHKESDTTEWLHFFRLMTPPGLTPRTSSKYSQWGNKRPNKEDRNRVNHAIFTLGNKWSQIPSPLGPSRQ